VDLGNFHSADTVRVNGKLKPAIWLSLKIWQRKIWCWGQNFYRIVAQQVVVLTVLHKKDSERWLKRRS